MADAAPQEEGVPASSSSGDETFTFSRAYLRALHEKPMKAAWSRHVTGAVEFIKTVVLREALAGYSERDFSSIVDIVPTADEVLKAIVDCSPNPTTTPPPGVSFTGAPETWKASGKLDSKTGLLVAVSSSGRSGLRFSGQCMPDIVSALKLVFPDSDVAFVKAAPSSGGKDVLSVRWS